MKDNSSKIRILCATDENYVPYCGIMLTSVLENNPNVEIFVMIDYPLSRRDYHKFIKLEKKYCTTIHFVQIEKNDFTDWPIPVNSSYTLANYYRLAAADLLPKDIDRILYLDCDIIVNGSLQELYNRPLEDKSVAVVYDIFYQKDECYERLQYPKEKGYFNSGVMLINLEFWRSHRLTTEFRSYVKMHTEPLLYVDQDILNYVLQDSKIQVDWKWNYQVWFLHKCYFDTFTEKLKHQVLQVKNPIIIHFIGEKPWKTISYNTPFFNLWHRYKKKSYWATIKEIYPDYKRFKFYIKRHFLWPLGLLCPNKKEQFIEI